jgi:uncharacterized protein (UPF0261 family)
MVNFGARETVPEKYRGRNFYIHNPQVTLMRTTPDECVEIARFLARGLNACEGPVRFLLPTGGVSALDAPGQAFWDPEADEAGPDGVTELRRALERATARADRMRRRAELAERKLRWFTPHQFRRVLRRLAR